MSKVTINDVSAPASAADQVVNLAVSLDVANKTDTVVSFHTSEGTASAGAGDYVGNPAGRITIPAGKLSADILVTVHPKASGKAFSVLLTGVTPGSTLAKTTGAVTIGKPALVANVIPPEQPNVAPAPIPAPAANTAGTSATDIADLLNKATAPVTLTPGLYTCNSQVVLKQSVKASGATIVCPKLADDASNIKFSAPGITFDGAILPTGGVLLEFAADKCSVTNCQIGLGRPAGAVVQAFKTVPGGTNATVANTHVGVTQTVSAYFDEGGVSLEAVTLDGSTDEYALRLEVPASGAKQSGAKITNCNFANGTRKDTCGVRVFDNVVFTGGTILGDVRLGQDPPATGPQTNALGQYCNGVTFTGVAFTANGSPMSAVEAYEGVNATVTDCTFSGYTVPPISAGVFSEITTKGNTQKVVAGQRAPEFFATSSKGKQVDQGGNVQAAV